MSRPVIQVEGLKMSYGDVEVLAGIDLEIRAGEVFAFLGPNGAGKTTTVEILEGYRRRTAGTVSVLGEDPAHAGGDWRARIGVVLQESEPESELTVAECVSLYAGYYPKARSIGETLDLVGLASNSSVRCGRLSGGQRRRLDVALALIGDPELVFLDEPTTGFDPSARRGAWDVIAGLRDLGKTIFLTTTTWKKRSTCPIGLPYSRRDGSSPSVLSSQSIKRAGCARRVDTVGASSTGDYVPSIRSLVMVVRLGVRTTASCSSSARAHGSERALPPTTRANTADTRCESSRA